MIFFSTYNYLDFLYKTGLVRVNELASKYSNKNIIIKPFIECLKQLDEKSDFIDFRDTLKKFLIIINLLLKH